MNLKVDRTGTQMSYKGVEFDAKLEQLMRYVRGSAADKLPKEEFCALMESMLTRMMDLSDGQAMIDMANDRLRAENAAKDARIVELEDALRMILIQDQFLHRDPTGESTYYYNSFDVDVIVNDALKGKEE